MLFVVPGPPVPKARPRVTRFGHTYTPQKTVDQENKIREAFLLMKWESTDEPLTLRIRAFMPIPTTLSKSKRKLIFWHSKRPDADNIAKLVMDALNGLAYKDDGQIASLKIEKFYSENPRTEIEIKKLEKL